MGGPVACVLTTGIFIGQILKSPEKLVIVYIQSSIYTRGQIIEFANFPSCMYTVDSSRTQLSDPCIFKKGFISGDLWSTVVNSMINFNFMIRHIWIRISVV